MRARLLAAGILAASGLVAWLTVTNMLAARALQLAIAGSLVYVGWLAWRGSRVVRRAVAAAREASDGADGLDGSPFVSLIVPARNEAEVIGPTVAGLACITYRDAVGRPAFEVVVVDDGSGDETAERALRAAAGHAHVRVLRRDGVRGTAGTKGAVLAWAMPQVRGEVVGVLDADTRVSPQFLDRVMRAWAHDPRAAALQAARMPRNASRSWLTAAQAEEQLMDLTSQCGRWVTDGTAELRGNGMFVRAAVLSAVGGWDPTALTEDLELSTRMAAAGEHIALAPAVEVGEEAVEAVAALWRQRLRWAEGSLRRLIDHGPRLLLGPQPLARKADFLAFAAEFLVPPLFVTTIIASIVTVVTPQPADWTVPASLFLGYGAGVFLLALGGLSAVGERGLRLLGRAVRGSLFLSHWLVIVPYALGRIAVGPTAGTFTPTPRFLRDGDR